jgi:hypothetical protein
MLQNSTNPVPCGSDDARGLLSNALWNIESVYLAGLILQIKYGNPTKTTKAKGKAKGIKRTNIFTIPRAIDVPNQNIKFQKLSLLRRVFMKPILGSSYLSLSLASLYIFSCSLLREDGFLSVANLGKSSMSLAYNSWFKLYYLIVPKKMWITKKFPPLDGSIYKGCT